MEDNKTGILEIFSSVQGEGLKIGERHIFIRFHGCNLKCAFCDVSNTASPEAVNIEDITARIDALNEGRIHNTLALTGGEPLLHSKFLKGLLPEMIDRGFKIYLETNGTLSHELNDIIEYIDTIAIDLKLPSVTKDRPRWQEHSDFLRTAFKREFFLKTVVSSDVDMEDFDKAVEITRAASFDIPFIIQPETKPDSSQINIEPELLLKLQARALKSINNVLIIPQAHKMLGVR